ncbi:TlpA family protein disulfide reductase [Neisseriaceae bacterium TC5R-5]|nr:TlpA family protein disulfide reductase [Neisseriaceae bacterium TC5R-5]
MLFVVCLPSNSQANPALERAVFTDLQGSRTNTARFKGKVTVVNFWATWCGPCRQEMPMLNTMRKKLSPQGVEVVGIALDSKDEVKRFISSIKVSYPILLGDSDTLDVLRSLGNKTGGLPYTLVLDRQGRIVSQFTGLLDEKRLTASIKPHL